MIFVVTAHAQNLPNIQKTSVWAPPNIKIDGKVTEWQDKYQAYNHATDVYYTICNDNDNLYLVIKATNRIAIAGKILAAGISFTINHTLKKKDTASVTVTYPTLQGKDRELVSGLFYGILGMHIGGTPGGDNSLTRLNSTLTEKSKYIGITGIKDFPDNEISVYNNEGIKAASAFNAPSVYVYELAIPLKFLALPDDGAQGFSYHIKMNIPKEMQRTDAVGSRVPNSDAPPPPPPDPNFVTSTDFWGEYTLAKKP